MLTPLKTARRAWDAQPMLAYTYGDFQCFEEHWRACHMPSMDDSVDRFQAWFAASEKDLEIAQQRLAISRNPLGACPPPSIAQRQGDRLILWLYGPITSIAPLVDALRDNADALAVILRIDSPGGLAVSALALARAIENHKGRTLAIVDRTCWSGAVFAAVACDRVFVRANATMMIHLGRHSAAGNCDELQRASIAAGVVDLHHQVYLRTRRGITREAVNAMLPREHFMDAAEAVAFGLADRVIHPLCQVVSAAPVPADDRPRMHPEETPCS